MPGHASAPGRLIEQLVSGGLSGMGPPQNLRWAHFEFPIDKPDSVDVAIGRSFLWEHDCSSPLAAYPQRVWRAERSRCLFGLAPTGACHAKIVANLAVSSYLTFSPLPGSLEDPWRCIFCGALRRIDLDPPRRYLAICSVVSGLSSKVVFRDRLIGNEA